MKNTDRKKKYAFLFTFKYKILIAGLGGMLMMFAIISVMFMRTRMEMREDAIEKVFDNMTLIQNDLEQLNSDIISLADMYALDEKLLSEIEMYSTETDPVKRRYHTLNLNTRFFSAYNFFSSSPGISLIYTSDFEFFNFLDPNCDGKEVEQTIRKIDEGQKGKMSHLTWYPLQDNVLKQTPYGEARKDKVVIGARNVFSFYRSDYVATFLFAVREEEIYHRYAELAEIMGADVYILSEKNELLSSSREDVVISGKLPERILTFAEEGIQDNAKKTKDIPSNLLFMKESPEVKFKIVLDIQEKKITGEIEALYAKIFLVVIGCLVVYGILFGYFYRRFMEPMALLNCSMNKVNQGDMDAYVKWDSYDEMGNMIRCYNFMLKSINEHVEHTVMLEKKKNELELEVLMNQINPHFLYNTLETIVWKANEAKRPDIGRIAASLGRLYRLSISNGELMVRVQQEIEHVVNYLSIQKSRYEELFQFELDVDYEQIRDLYMIKMILQPIVENCFNHAMDEEEERVLKIKVKIRRQGDYFQVVVIDNGLGMDKNRLESVRHQILTGEKTESTQKRKSTGIGLYSVNQRLALYVGEKRAVHLYSKYGMGTIITVKMPCITEKDRGKL